jgi:hypothetical protein
MLAEMIWIQSPVRRDAYRVRGSLEIRKAVSLLNCQVGPQAEYENLRSCGVFSLAPGSQVAVKDLLFTAGGSPGLSTVIVRGRS